MFNLNSQKLRKKNLRYFLHVTEVNYHFNIVCRGNYKGPCMNYVTGLGKMGVPNL